MKPHEKAFMIVGTVAVMAASGIVGYGLFATPDTASNLQTSQSSVSTPSSSTTSSTPNSTTNTSNSTTTNSQTATGSYKDGTYTGQASYMVPNGSNTINVTVTVSGGKIVSASATHGYSDRESGMYVDSFDSSLSSNVNGESLADITVSRIGGASLTTEAFAEVLDTIKSEASA